MRTIPLLLLFTASALAQEYGETYRLKIDVSGQRRTVALFVPKSITKKTRAPLLIALPAKEKAFGEVGQWQQPAYDKKFCLLSFDITTASVSKPWHPSDALDMQRDLEAFDLALAEARNKMQGLGLAFDESAIALTGHSGAGYAFIWIGLRRPFLLGLCGRSIVFYKGTTKFGDMDKSEPNFNVPIYLLRGELDNVRVKKTTDQCLEELKANGWKRATLKLVEKMGHEPKPELAVEWFEKLLKSTASGRAAAGKVVAELEKLAPDLEKGKAGSLGKLVKLAERERKAGFKAGAVDRLAEYEKKAAEELERAANLAADNQLLDAIPLLKAVEKNYKGLDAAKDAKKTRIKLQKSDEFKATEMLDKAKALREKGKGEKATLLLEKLVDKYPKTLAAERAKAMLGQ